MVSSGKKPKKEECFETFPHFNYITKSFILFHMALSEDTDIGSLIQFSGNGDHNDGLEENKKCLRRSLICRNKDAPSKIK